MYLHEKRFLRMIFLLITNDTADQPNHNGRTPSMHDECYIFLPIMTTRAGKRTEKRILPTLPTINLSYIRTHTPLLPPKPLSKRRAFKLVHHGMYLK